MVKRYFCMVGIALSLGLNQQAVSSSGIPTLDINSVEQLNALLDQLETAQAQLRQAESQLKALTESSGFGYVVRNPKVRDHMRKTLPTDVTALLDRLDSQNSALSAPINEYVQSAHAPVEDFGQERKDLKERSLRVAATRKALSRESYEAIGKHLEVIDDLQNQINQTNNPKEISELQAQIAIEQANMQATQTRLDLAMEELSAEQDLIKARGDKVYSGWFGSGSIRE